MIKQITALLIIIGAAFFLFNYSFSKNTDKPKCIETIINYPMDTITKRCQKDHNYSDEDMAILEKELKRFFIMALLKKDSSTGMYSQDVDNLWHTFILFTKDYDLFCKKCFGYFLHHVPEDKSKTKTEQELVASRKDFQMFIKNYEEMFKQEIHPIWLLDLV